MNKSEVDEAEIMRILEGVPDPEIPVLSVVDLGIISSVNIKEDKILISMTPTFSGCPALNFIQKNIEEKVTAESGMATVVTIDHSRKWTSDFISEKGREALKSFRLAPPKKINGSLDINDVSSSVCPHCGSANTTMRSPFGSALCRAMHYCYNCKQMFEQFKPV